jgi:hypothetical protein
MCGEISSLAIRLYWTATNTSLLPPSSHLMLCTQHCARLCRYSTDILAGGTENKQYVGNNNRRGEEYIRANRKGGPSFCGWSQKGALGKNPGRKDTGGEGMSPVELQIGNSILAEGTAGAALRWEHAQ